MKRIVLMACLLIGFSGSVSAQLDDLYFVPKKKKTVQEVSSYRTSSQQETWQTEEETAAIAPAKQLEVDEDAYNRRGSNHIEQDDGIDAESIVVITEEGDTMRMYTDTLRLTRVEDGEGWVNGFEGSDSDYEYAMRIVRFRNPRYAIPVSSPLYWDVVYGGALYPSWDWNVYDDGMYAYVFPTSSNWYYWDYRMNYPFGWSVWNDPWAYHHGYHWGHHWGGHYAHVWYDPCFSPGWHYGHHHGYYPGFGKPGWNQPKAHPNYRTAMASSTRRNGQASNATARRIDNGSSRNASVRSASAVRSSNSSSRTTASDDVIRRSTGSSSVSRSSSNGSSRSSSSYSRPSSTRSSSSSVGRSSSSGSSRSGISSGGSSSSSRSSSYSSGSSSRSSSYSSGGGARSVGGSSRSGGSRR